MAAEEILTLFDFCWFERRVFSGEPPFSHPWISPVEVEAIVQEPAEESKLQTIRVRSQSDYSMSSKTVESLTTDPIPTSLKLRTIFSGKEEEIPEKDAEKVEEVGRKGRVKKRGRRKLVAGGSKSLSELEFMELKGFMDLGFMFSEEEYKNPNLVSIIPGLQRRGRRREEEEQEQEEEEEEEGKEENGSVISRPYLSEAWEDFDESTEKSLLMNWRIPILGTTEIAMKDHLKFWAQTVASTTILSD